MLSEAKQLLTMVEGYHNDIKKMLAEVDADGLNWEPTDDGKSNSLYAITVHIALVEQLCVNRLNGAVSRAAIPSEPEWSQGDIGLKSRGESAERPLELLDKAFAGLQQVLSEMTAEKMDGAYQTSRGELANRWLAWHPLDHTAEHWGQMEITRQLFLKLKS